MIGDELAELDIMDELHVNDCIIINDARNVMSSAPVTSFKSGDGSDRVWFDKNVQAQERLMNMKSRIDYLLSGYNIKFYRRQHLVMSDAGFEFLKSKDEKLAKMFFDDQEICDLKATIDKFTAISRYIDSLLWCLKDLMKLFK